MVVDRFVIVFEGVEIGMTEEDGIESVMVGFGCGECGSEGEEVVVGLDISFFERGFEEVWTRLGLVEGLIVGVFLVCVILVYGILAGAYEILLYGIKIRVTSEEAEWSDGFSVIFREDGVFESDEAVFFVVGFVRADFGEVIVIFEEEEGEDEINENNNA